MTNPTKQPSREASRLIFLHALSSLHCGIGQGTGVIDLPITREAGTNLPFLPGSSLKGNLRAAAKSDGMDAEDWLTIFGPETKDAAEHAGALSFGDVRLVALPVRSLGGTFAWATNPYLLNRLSRDAEAVGLHHPPVVPPLPAGMSYVAEPGTLGADSNHAHAVLEEIETKLRSEDIAKKWGEWLAKAVWPNDVPEATIWRGHFLSRFVILGEDDFQFLCEHGTEVVARVAIDQEKGTVAKGALWYEERLPAESLLAGIVLGRSSRREGRKATGEEMLRKAFSKPITRQFGGKVNVGRGLCRLVPVNPE